MERNTGWDFFPCPNVLLFPKILDIESLGDHKYAHYPFIVACMKLKVHGITIQHFFFLGGGGRGAGNRLIG